MEKRPWYEAWLTPIGAMVVMLVLNLGMTTWQSFYAQDQRRHTNEQVVQHRIRNEEVHKELADFILCIADHPPGTSKRAACIKQAIASAE